MTRNDPIDTFDGLEAFSEHLRKLHDERKARKSAARAHGVPRAPLTKADKKAVLEKTDGLCHLCGGKIEASEPWQADHVWAHSSGGRHAIANYLAAHDLCNNYRWHYGPEEFQWILKLGVWLRMQVARETDIGRRAGEQFFAYEKRRATRRVANRT